MKRLMVVGVSVLLAASPALAKAGSASLKWMAGPPGLPAGSKFAVVSGDPGKAGMFTIRADLPANYTVPPHWHPADEHLKVLKGSIAFGMGDKVDRVHPKWMAAGAAGTAKAKMNHYVFTKSPAEIEVKAMGPFQITYVNPKDDPRH